MKKKSVCLNMIVKNERRVIERCLASVKDIIDYWVIVDTGSTDGTQEAIINYLRGIPGELHQRPWVDFSHNRNEALELAKGKGDYFLFIDADEELLFSGPKILPELNKDFYVAIYRQELTDSQRVLMIGTNKKWEWKGVMHEAIYCLEDKFDGQYFDNIILSAVAKDGCRSLDPEKYQKEAAVLEKALETDPLNTRYVLCLAGAYASAKDYASSLKNYEKRASMGGCPLEVFISLYQAAVCQVLLDMKPSVYVNSFIRAYLSRQSRAEPLFYLTNCFIRQEQFLLGYLVSQYALTIPLTNDNYFTQPWIYEWGTRAQFIDCANAIGRFDEANEAMKKILEAKSMPADVRKSVQDLLTQRGL